MHESAELQEAQKLKKVFEFFNLDEEQSGKLKERIRASKGLVRIFVHTFPNEGIDQPDKDRINQIVRGVLLSDNPTPPVILFEEFQVADILSEHIGNALQEKPNEIYIVKTLTQWSYPVVDELPMPTTLDIQNHTESAKTYCVLGIKRLVEGLAKLGVNDLLVGGTRLVIHEGEINECVGQLINMIEAVGEPLDKEFNIKVSNATAPVGREGLRGIRDDLV